MYMLAFNMLCVEKKREKKSLAWSQLMCLAGIYPSHLHGYYIFREQKRLKAKQPMALLRNSECCAEIQISIKLICQFAIWVIPDL